MSFDPMSLIQMGVVALVALILGLFVVRPILMKEAPAAVPALANVVEDEADDEPIITPAVALSGELDDGGGFASFDTSDALVPGEPALPQDPVDRLRALISERQDETVEVLRGWLDEKSEKA